MVFDEDRPELPAFDLGFLSRIEEDRDELEESFREDREQLEDCPACGSPNILELSLVMDMKGKVQERQLQCANCFREWTQEERGRGRQSRLL